MQITPSSHAWPAGCVQLSFYAWTESWLEAGLDFLRHGSFVGYFQPGSAYNDDNF